MFCSFRPAHGSQLLEDDIRNTNVSHSRPSSFDAQVQKYTFELVSVMVGHQHSEHEA